MIRGSMSRTTSLFPAGEQLDYPDMKEFCRGNIASYKIPRHLVICDQMMEPLNGIEFSQLLRTSNDSPDRFVPVIMVTGNSDVATVNAA